MSGGSPGDAADCEPRAGAVTPEIAAELPGLRLRWSTVTAGPGPVSAGIRARLRDLSDRGRGIDAVTLRARSVGHAYRAAFRQLGLDPDRERPPAERVAVQRLLRGGLEAVDRVDAACLIAIVETGVGVWALDATAVGDGGPSLCLDDTGGPGHGRLVVAGASGVLAALFDDPRPEASVSCRTRRIVLFAVGVAGVPELSLHEALWVARDALG